MKVSEAIAKAVFDSGVKAFTFVPGYGGNQIYSDYCRLYKPDTPFSFNEEVAFTIAHGCGITGSRAATIMKSHGFAKAANSIIDSLTIGTNGGFIVLVSDDKHGNHSDSIFDFEKFIKGVGLPYSRLDEKNIYEKIIKSFNLSEEIQLPYVLIFDSSIIGCDTEIIPSEIISQKTKPFKKDILKYVLCPDLSNYQHRKLKEKLNNGPDLSLEPPILPVIPDSIRPNWRQTIVEYSNFFSIFKSFKGDIVTGDTGLSSLFAFPPYNCIDIVTYMGGSIPLAMGAILAGYKNVWSVTGDFAFISAGYLGLIEAVNRNLPLKIAIINNKKAQATGGQNINENILWKMLSGYKEYIHKIKNPNDLTAIEFVLKQVTENKNLDIIVIEY